MTHEQFFAWVQADGGRLEFDGFEPVAMPRSGRARIRDVDGAIAAIVTIAHRFAGGR